MKRNKKLIITRPFEKCFSKLPKHIRQTTYEKLDLLLANPSHPSLRVKKITGTSNVWELSVTMNYRLTFEEYDDEIFLRKIGTHNILNHS